MLEKAQSVCIVQIYRNSFMVYRQMHHNSFKVSKSVYRSDSSQFFHREEAQQRVYRTDSSQFFHREKAQHVCVHHNSFVGKHRIEAHYNRPNVLNKRTESKREQDIDILPDPRPDDACGGALSTRDDFLDVTHAASSSCNHVCPGFE